ncbi:MAG: hypothetical protein EOP89_15410, partial [Lysobacteraceae bacterium]
MTLSRFAFPFTIVAGALASIATPSIVDAQAKHYSADSEQAHGPQKLVDKAASVVIEMAREPKIDPLMKRAVGMYVIPEYGRAGFIIGGRG